jgi:phage terminase small subunit
MSKKDALPDGDELIKNFILQGCTNGKQAAIDANYSPKTAEQSASRVLRSVKAKKLIAEYKKTQLIDYVWSKQDKLHKIEKLIDCAMQTDPEKGMINMAAAMMGMKEHNLMQGDNAPIVTDSTGDQTILISFKDV